MNESRYYSRFTVSKLAELLMLESPKELEGYFIGDHDPTFHFINTFSSTFGVNEKWLKEGSGHPYSNDDKQLSDPLEYYMTIIQAEPEVVYFVRERTDIAQTCMVIKFSAWRYKVIQQNWHISGHVGAGGPTQLLSFYRLIKKLKDKSEFSIICRGLTLDRDEFSELENGEVFPGKYLDCGKREDLWWDYLTDIYHGYSIAEDYERIYGKSFTDAQSIIRRKIETEG